MGCRKGSPKGHILDHGLRVELQKAVLLEWLMRPVNTFTPVPLTMGRRTICRVVITLLLAFGD